MEQQTVDIDVMVADESHEKYVDTILETIEAAAKVRGTGIAKRTHEYVTQKMKEGKVIIALKVKNLPVLHISNHGATSNMLQQVV